MEVRKDDEKVPSDFKREVMMNRLEVSPMQRVSGVTSAIEEFNAVMAADAELRQTYEKFLKMLDAHGIRFDYISLR